MDKLTDLLSLHPTVFYLVALVVGIAAVSIIIFYNIAFWQGRSISFWPPKFGSKPSSPTAAKPGKPVRLEPSTEKKNLRGVMLSEAVETVGLTDIESRNEGGRHLPPETLYAWPGLKELAITGISAASSFQNHLALVKRLLANGAHVYFIVCREDTAGLDHMTKLEMRNVKDEIAQVRYVIKAEGLGDDPRFHIRAFAGLPTFTSVMLNGDISPRESPQASSDAFIRVQPRRMESTHHEGIVLQFINSGRELDGFALFAADLRVQWKNAQTW
jgi:hypothetical protein